MNSSLIGSTFNNFDVFPFMSRLFYSVCIAVFFIRPSVLIFALPYINICQQSTLD